MIVKLFDKNNNNIYTVQAPNVVCDVLGMWDGGWGVHCNYTL